MTNDKLSDRERILTAIIVGLQTASVLCRHGDPYNALTWQDRCGGSPYFHFARYREPVKGDLVIGSTGRNDQWKIAIYEEYADPSVGLHVVRDINSGQLCNYGNESFVPIVGLSYTERLIGDERRLYEKVLSAFYKADEYLYRFGGIHVDGARATVTIRERHGGYGRESAPFDVAFDWTPKMTIKAILQALRDGGLGTRDFAPRRVVDDFGTLVRTSALPEIWITSPSREA